MFHGQKLHLKAILGNLGLFLHVPAIMAGVTILISSFFGEHEAILPLVVTAAVGIGAGQLLYRIFFHHHPSHLWDAMVIAAIGWAACSVIGAIPIYWIAKLEVLKGSASSATIALANPANALFEAISGFTSTGLTMIKEPSELSHTILWWRSFMQWIGGLGLIVFVLSMTELKLQGYQLYYAEAHIERTNINVKKTARAIWALYSIYTLFGILLFIVLRMPIWEALNHGMTFISTGGFTVKDSNFQNYSRAIQSAGLFIMVLGSMGFALQYQALKSRSIKKIFMDWQHRLLFIVLICGALLLWLVDIWDDISLPLPDTIFEWFSALTTCGFSTVNLDGFGGMGKLLLIVAMTLGGCSGSTAGGIKLQRLMYLFAGIVLRVKTITDSKEKAILSEYKNLREPSGITLPQREKTEKLYAAGVVFFLWLLTVLIGTILLLKWVPESQTLDALFDVISATSNAGLTSGIIGPNFQLGGKVLFMFLMWIGRLEIISVLILILSLPLFLRNRKK